MDRLIAFAQRAGGARDLPIAAAALLALNAAAEVLNNPVEPVSVPLMLGLAATVPLAFIRTRILAVTAIVASAFVTTVLATGGPPTVSAIIAVAVVLGVLGLRLGRHLRARATRWDAARRAAADTLIEFAARGERARIARELHDVVAHHLSMITLQAEAARVSAADPEGSERLAAIAGTARSALTEMRRLLGVLREDADAAPIRTPQPGLQQLVELIDQARQASRAPARLIVRGPVAPLDPGVELTAYRIVQEALTNTRRHARSAGVDVELTYGEQALLVRVRDNGPAPLPAMPALAGHGLVGMRERASMLGGTVSAGPGPGCGFLVEACLPIPLGDKR